VGLHGGGDEVRQALPGVALVDRDQHSQPHSLFAARVATSRGWQIGAFACEVEAARWLAAG